MTVVSERIDPPITCSCARESPESDSRQHCRTRSFRPKSSRPELALGIDNIAVTISYFHVRNDGQSEVRKNPDKAKAQEVLLVSASNPASTAKRIISRRVLMRSFFSSRAR